MQVNGRERESSPLARCEDEGRRIVEMHADGTIRHGETHAILVAVIEPGHHENSG
jgi:hypothetical protein